MLYQHSSLSYTEFSNTSLSLEYRYPENYLKTNLFSRNIQPLFASSYINRYCRAAQFSPISLMPTFAILLHKLLCSTVCMLRYVLSSVKFHFSACQTFFQQNLVLTWPYLRGGLRVQTPPKLLSLIHI